MFENRLFRVDMVGVENVLWRYTVKGAEHVFDIAPPVFEVDGQMIPAVPAAPELLAMPLMLSNGATEYVYGGPLAADETLALEMVFWIAPENPVLRFCYRLRGGGEHVLSKRNGADALRYLSLSLADLDACAEIRLSEFEELVHSFQLARHEVQPAAFAYELDLMGPILVAGDGAHTALVAYEHGSQVPDAFLAYHLGRDRSATLQAVKGNYAAGQAIKEAQPYQTIWLHFAAVAGDETALAKAYRDFICHYMTLNVESRRPYIFYNTWNYQERNKWWNGQTFLASMHQDRILAEIDVAHRMGVEVFVIDTGWYEKTGDWQVSRARFPDGLRAVRQRLERYGMKLGLWFSPTQAAVSSHIAQAYAGCRMSWEGRVAEPRPVWETEASYRMCLVSDYWQAFADELIRLARELGVTYFKWDAIGQYGCNDPHHHHGTAENSPAERADCYAFELPRYMARIVDRVCAACPEAIVDFDITEGHRAVGLGFLAAGKYFLINNGPYYRSLDDPEYAPGGGMGANVFVFPGPARARVCRTPLDYDRWIPSVLFLTHYLPDPPASSQLINLASLVLGQNGIWGDLLQMPEEGVALFAQVLDFYRQVRDDVTASSPVRQGPVGGSPEIHEKIASNGRGLVSAFAPAAGRYVYVTRHPVVTSYWASEGMTVTRDEMGRARLELQLDGPGAGIVFFGTEGTI